MQYDLSKINQLIQDGFVLWNKHPTLPIYVYNYSNKCQYSSYWNDLTKKCRGLILKEDTGELIAKGFDKFFNYNEPLAKIPEGIPDIYEKYDGSLIIATYYQNNLVVATRGSFVSEQATIATRLIENNPSLLEYIKYDNNKHTFLFELVGPSNKIVVRYDRDELIFLGAVDNSTEKDIKPEIFIDNVNTTIASKLLITNENYFEELKNLNHENKEGFVLRWEFSDGRVYRLKYKFESYINLHKILFSMNKKDIIDYLMKDKINELYEILPDEEYKELVKFVDEVKNEYNLIKQMCTDYLVKMKSLNYSRKEIAINVFKDLPNYSAIIFNMLDNKDFSAEIWKIIKSQVGT